MKKWMAVLSAAIMALSATSVAFADQLSDIQAKGVLELGANIEFPPYEFYWTNPETGEEEVAGFDMDLARGIAQELHIYPHGPHGMATVDSETCDDLTPEAARAHQWLENVKQWLKITL